MNGVAAAAGVRVRFFEAKGRVLRIESIVYAGSGEGLRGHEPRAKFSDHFRRKETVMPFFDPTMFILIPALIFAFWAQWKVQHTYKKFSKVRAANGRTGREMALAIMSRNGVSDVAVEEVGGVLRRTS